SNPANDDGFFLLTKHPGSMPVFKATTLPYLKMRYSISGITKDTNGNPVNPANVQAQFFIWFNESFNAVPYKSYCPYNSNFEDGDVIEVILDMSYVTAENKNNPGVWVRNITKGETEYTAKTVSYRNEDNSTNSNPNGSGAIRNSESTFREVRLNLARVRNLDRYAEFEYAGYFASLDEAMAFDSVKAVEEKLQEAENSLRALATSDTVIPWSAVAKEQTEISDSKATLKADGSFDTSGVKTQTVVAILGLRQWINSYIGAEGNVEITGYTPATTTTKGSITFNMDLESAYQKRRVENVTVNFSEKPDDYYVWRFNDPAILSKGNFSTSANNVKVEDNLLKVDHKDPRNSSGFSFTVWPAVFGQETFTFNDYPYVLMKYKRMGDISPAAFTFINSKGEQNSISNIGWGWYADDWYYTLYNTTIRDKVTPQSYNYNVDRDSLEDLTYCKSYAAPTAAPFTGELRSLAFDFGSRWYADRELELEFIAFFPSMADARNYVQNIEALEDAKADAVFDMAGYTADNVSYYDGNTQAVAEDKAKAIIKDKISAPGIDVAVTTVSYTAPGEADGSYVFNAVVTLGGEHVYTTENITLTIGKDVDSSPVVYKFTNPGFIQTVNGASEEYDFFGMSLTGKYFVLEVGADKPNVVADVYNTLKLDAAFTGGFTAIINDAEEIVYEGDADGAVYLDLGNFAGNIDTVKVQFNNGGAKVRALGFFTDNATAEAYNFNEIPAALSAAAARLGGSHSYTYQQSKTISDVFAHSNDAYIRDLIANSDIIVADVEVTKYEHSTPTQLGYAEVTATLGYGDKTATQYTTVTYPVTLAKDEEVITVTPKSIGHEFMGYDLITANNNFASAPKTIEFNIMVSSDKLFGTVPVLVNGGATVNLVEGKIVVNGSLSSASVLKANTWTHVAITSDGKIYIDGALDASGSSVTFYTTAPVIGGGTSAGAGFVGHLLDVRFWNDVRTAEEIAANKTTLTDSDGLLANWMLNAENYKWLEYFDSSANNNTATFKSYGWYKMEAGLQGDYSFIHYGDTQSHFAIAPRSYKRIPDVFEWIGNNVDKYNIAHVSILGDATQNNTAFEWGVIREAHRFIDGKTTYYIPLGNHDYPSPSSGVGAEIRDTTNYRNAFLYDDYVETYGPDGMNTFGGTFRDEKDLTNMYNLVSVGGVDYIFFSLEYGPRDSVLEWVGDVLTQYPERQAIISTHCYFSMDGTLTTSNSTTNREFSDGNEGIDIYNKLVTKYPNIIIVDCGHSQGDDTKQHPHQRGSSYKNSPTADDFGNDVVQMLVDASAYALNYPTNEVGFGADEGLIIVMMFEDN
ncbi:MAG: hypothetical protein IJO52_05090, partial [Clostridia bacterium]|nr:hypothetical protein [Clostridia bacterium]